MTNQQDGEDTMEMSDDGFIEVDGKRYSRADLEAMPVSEFRKVADAWEQAAEGRAVHPASFPLNGSAVPTGIFMGAMSLPGFGIPVPVDEAGLVHSAAPVKSNIYAPGGEGGGESEELKRYIASTVERNGATKVHFHSYQKPCNERCRVEQ